MKKSTGKIQNASAIDKRTLPVCIERGCMKRVEVLPGGRCSTRCYEHMSVGEQNAWSAAWKRVEK